MHTEKRWSNGSRTLECIRIGTYTRWFARIDRAYQDIPTMRSTNLQRPDWWTGTNAPPTEMHEIATVSTIRLAKERARIIARNSLKKKEKHGLFVFNAIETALGRTIHNSNTYSVRRQQQRQPNERRNDESDKKIIITATTTNIF